MERLWFLEGKECLLSTMQVLVLFYCNNDICVHLL